MKRKVNAIWNGNGSNGNGLLTALSLGKIAGRSAGKYVNLGNPCGAPNLL